MEATSQTCVSSEHLYTHTHTHNTTHTTHTPHMKIIHWLVGGWRPESFHHYHPAEHIHNSGLVCGPIIISTRLVTYITDGPQEPDYPMTKPGKAAGAPQYNQQLHYKVNNGWKLHHVNLLYVPIYQAVHIIIQYCKCLHKHSFILTGTTSDSDYCKTMAVLGQIVMQATYGTKNFVVLLMRLESI